jgi:hypothetical protein
MKLLDFPTKKTLVELNYWNVWLELKNNCLITNNDSIEYGGVDIVFCFIGPWMVDLGEFWRLIVVWKFLAKNEGF